MISGALSPSQCARLPSRALMPLMFQVTTFMECSGRIDQAILRDGQSRFGSRQASPVAGRRAVPLTPSNGKAGAAAAGCHGVGISDLERLSHQIIDEINH